MGKKRQNHIQGKGKQEEGANYLCQRWVENGPTQQIPPKAISIGTLVESTIETSSLSTHSRTSEYATDIFNLKTYTDC